MSLSVHKGDAEHDGSCQACKHQTFSRVVYLITIGDTVVRLCKKHLDELHKLARKAN